MFKSRIKLATSLLMAALALSVSMGGVLAGTGER
jgi:hypothetical protein